MAQPAQHRTLIATNVIGALQLIQHDRPTGPRRLAVSAVSRKAAPKEIQAR